MQQKISADFASLSKAVAALEKSARKGAPAPLPPEESEITPFNQEDYSQVAYSQLLPKTQAIESIISKGAYREAGRKVELERFEKAIEYEKERERQIQEKNKPIQKPEAASETQTSKLETQDPRPETQAEQEPEGYELGLAAQGDLEKKISSIKEAILLSERGRTVGKGLSKKTEEAFVPTGVLGDVELARKEMQLAESERQNQALRERLEELERTNEEKLSEEAEELQKKILEESARQASESKRKLEFARKEMEDEHERKLAREIARLQAAGSPDERLKARSSGSTVLSQAESYLEKNQSAGEGVSKASSLLRNLLWGRKKVSSSASPPETQHTKPETAEPKPETRSPKLSRQEEDIESLREDFERKSREIREMLKKKSDKP